MGFQKSLSCVFVGANLLAQMAFGSPYYGNPYFMPQPQNQNLYARGGPMPLYEYMLDARNGLAQASSPVSLRPRQSVTTTHVELTPDEQAVYSQLEKQLIRDNSKPVAQGRADDQQQQLSSPDDLHAAGISASAATMNSLGQQFDIAIKNNNLAPSPAPAAGAAEQQSSSTTTSAPSTTTMDTSMSSSEATAVVEAQKQLEQVQSPVTTSTTAAPSAAAASGDASSASSTSSQLSSASASEKPSAAEQTGAVNDAAPASRDSSSATSETAAAAPTTTIEMSGDAVLSVSSGSGSASTSSFENGPPMTAAGPLAAIEAAQIFSGLNAHELEELEKPYSPPDKDQRIDEDVVMLPVINEDKAGVNQEFDHRYPDENKNNVVNTNKEIHTYTVQKKRISIKNNILHRHHKVINVNTDYVLNIHRIAHPHKQTETFVQTQVRHVPFIYVKHTRTDKVNDVADKVVEMPTEEIKQTATELPAIFEKTIIKKIDYDHQSIGAAAGSQSAVAGEQNTGAGAAAESAAAAAPAAPPAARQDVVPAVAQEAAPAAAALPSDASAPERKKRNFFRASPSLTKSGELLATSKGFANPVVIRYRKM